MWIALTALTQTKISHTIYWKNLFSILGMSGYML